MEKPILEILNIETGLGTISVSWNAKKKILTCLSSFPSVFVFGKENLGVKIIHMKLKIYNKILKPENNKNIRMQKYLCYG
jgi:hypothetical protein